MADASQRKRRALQHLRPFLRVRQPVLDPVERRLGRALTIRDLRDAARRRVPRAVFDYVDGAAEEEVALSRARALFRDLEFHPSALRDVSTVDVASYPLGGRSDLPFSLAPTGFTRLMHHDGEVAVARAAAKAGIPYSLSTMGTTSVEDLRSAVPAGRRWFQLYLWRDRDASADLVARAMAAGYEALIVTVDVPGPGARLRDVRNGLTFPPNLTPRTLADMATHPGWWSHLLAGEQLELASVAEWGGTIAEIVGRMFDPSVTLSDLEWLRSLWDGPLVVKGVQSVADARDVVSAGADVVQLSSHGGRQLDRAPTPLRLVPDTLDAVGDRAEVWIDTGVMNGGDIVAAHALGARNVLVGRAYLYGLMAGGTRGVERAIEILASEAARYLKLLGASSLSELAPSNVRLP